MTIYDYFLKLAILEVDMFECESVQERNIFRDKKEILCQEINNLFSYNIARKIYKSDEYTQLYNIIFDGNLSKNK